MRITLFELQKVFRTPVILFLLIVFIGFNTFLIFSNAQFRDELKVVNQIVEKYGLTFNDSTLEQLNRDIDKEMTKIDSNFHTAEDFFNQLTYEKYETYNVKNQKAIDQLSLFFMYYTNALSLDKRYQTINIEKIGEGLKETYQISGIAAKFIDYEHKKLEPRFQEMVKSEEYKTWFFAGDVYRMHSLLFRSILKTLAVEGTILVVLITALLACYEKDQNTSLVTFSTKVGRNVMKRKLFASLISSVIVGFVLFVTMLVTYFTLFDYHHLWKSVISSGLNWEYNLPYVTWWKISFSQFLCLAIIIIFLTWLLISMLTFALSIFIQNSYITTIATYLTLLAMFVIPSYIASSSVLLLLSQVNLTLLILNPHMYFNGLAGLTGFEHHELITISCWTMMIGILVWITLRRFSRKDLV